MGFNNISVLMTEILEEWSERKPAYELIIRSNVLRIFSKIIRIWKEDVSMAYDGEITDVIKKAVAYVSENYSTTNEEEVAEMCGISYNHFSVTFKKQTGQTFRDFLEAVKIQNARKLLLSTEQSITEIAYEVGYSSTSYFISRFKKQCDITPKQFRKKTLDVKVREADDV
jgi:AraC-like DNA-binding protein